jgi:hypothetical protein
MGKWKNKFCWRPLKHKGSTYWLMTVKVKYDGNGDIKKVKMLPDDTHMSIHP